MFRAIIAIKYNKYLFIEGFFTTMVFGGTGCTWLRAQTLSTVWTMMFCTSTHAQAPPLGSMFCWIKDDSV